MEEIISVADKGDFLEVVYKIKGSANKNTVLIRKKHLGPGRPPIDRVLIEAIKDLINQVNIK
ncbi:hypothetical protein [Burkholderia cepacia]|uniref:Uncharacterized protein n=1 Tax=Burkholderia cepacia TaxID=292 RepID=A0A8I1ANB5_BURCE|nr:hypothetical protein [Burkholderia cepacia]MBH9685242.1 hypothetical protein [Burkholderia cepacia]MBH9697969.1 hypothetical protein [Burkholderia cepacia]MBH9716303.1 hypothetical protein [Burkholderia cepacia]MBH9733542.1 hypothetical protein [Burkholderia cepacia]MBX3759911.1 hypothetical protein [Burkholderia cepacia]